MNREDARKLLGGYATGTLTAEERQALFAAALEDQELFDELMREEALREILADPVAKRRLSEATEPRRSWFARPFTWVSAGALASALGGAALMVWLAKPPVAPVREVAMQPPAVRPAAPSSAIEPGHKEPVAPPAIARRQPLPQREKKSVASADTRGGAAIGERAAPPAEVAPQGVPRDARIAKDESAPAEPPKAVVAEKPAPETPRSSEAEQRLAAGAAAAASAHAAPPPAPPVASGFLASNAAAPLTFRIQRQGPGGLFADLPPGASLEPSDTVRLSVRALRSGILNVTADAGDGRFDRLTASALRVDAGSDYVLGPWQFPEQRGAKRLVLSLAPASEARRSVATMAKARDAARGAEPRAAAQEEFRTAGNVSVTLPYK